ncbi:PD-(D/E)XK nuclease family protein [Empedobacter falsenii]
MKEELIEIEHLLTIVKSRIDAHLKFKEEYNTQLAFDFSLFQFFSIGENKISQVLAFFLDINQNHGQGDIFLKEFIKTFYEKDIEIKQIENVCEKVITKNRRIDVYIELKDLTIAIENKIWADDQNNQLRDYSNFLEKKSQGNYQLLYLNPYGLEPKSKSIDNTLKESLISQNKFKIIGYKQDIIPLINNWLVICEADNVSHFLKEFKKYLEIKFLGKNTLNMSKELREIIYSNEREVQLLVNEYKELENEILSKLNTVGKELDKIHLELSEGIELSKSGLFNWSGARVYKYSLSKGGNKIWIQFVKEEISLYSGFYLQEGTDTIFKDILLELGINNRIKINHKLNKTELINIFLNQVKIANESFKKYEKKLETE